MNWCWVWFYFLLLSFIRCFDSIFLLVSQISKTVLTFVSNSGAHQKLLKTQYFNPLKQLVVLDGQPHQLKDLMDCLISHNR